jgi:hypothetical protein
MNSPTVWWRWWGGGSGSSPWTTYWLRRPALAAAGITGRVRAFHDLRHTAITHDAASGASAITVMAKAGHRNMETTRAYLHLAGRCSATRPSGWSGGCSASRSSRARRNFLPTFYRLS